VIRAHQPGSEPIDIPETIPNPVVVPKPTPTPTEPAPKEPVRIPERVPGTARVACSAGRSGQSRSQLAETLAAAQERLVHLLSCDIEREPAGVAQLAAAGSSLDRHEIAARPATSASDQRPRKHPCRDRSSNANSVQGQNSAGSLEICA
jgi:hypothetical protein